ncbi:hypothetical protein LINPERPRIM_LOCUS31566 [Linum perenne]
MHSARCSFSTVWNFVGAWELLKDLAALCKVPERGLLRDWTDQLGEVHGGHVAHGFGRILVKVVLPF